MAGITGGGRAFEYIVDMATGAGRSGVLPGQWEMTVVETGGQPA